MLRHHELSAEPRYLLRFCATIASAALGLASACKEDAAAPGRITTDAPPRVNTPAPAAAPPGSGKSAAQAVVPAVVFLGDSLTAGFGLSESEALPAQIQKKFEAARLPYRSINAGRSADTSAGGLARLDWYFREGMALEAIVIGLGSNDAMRGLPLDALESNLRAIVRRIHERKPDAKVFIWGLRTFPNLGPEYVAAFAEIFPRVAATENAILIPFPLEGVAGNPELNQEDGIHPTARGTELVAQRIWDTLQQHL